MNLKCVVVCTNASGVPDALSIKVVVSKKGYSEGQHYEEAKLRAEKEGYEGPMIVFDENDNTNRLFESALWLTIKETK